MRKGDPAQEEFRAQMKAKAATLSCPYDDCENHTQAGMNRPSWSLLNTVFANSILTRLFKGTPIRF